MRTPVPEKLLKLADDIRAEKSVPLTRLTVLKKWFEVRPGRLPAFGAWVARHAAGRKGKTRGAKAGALFDAARALLGDAGKVRPAGPVPIDVVAAAALRERLYEFQSEYDPQRWGPVRIIRVWDLLLVERGLDLILRPHAAPTEGYKLAAHLCQNYDPRYGNGLNGPSRGKVMEIARFLSAVEALEDAQEAGAPRRRTSARG